MSFPPPLLFCFSSTQQSTTLNSTQLNWIALEKRTGGQQQQQRHCHHPSDILTDILDYCFKFVFFSFLLKKKAMAFVRETLDGAVQWSSERVINGFHHLGGKNKLSRSRRSRSRRSCSRELSWGVESSRFAISCQTVDAFPFPPPSPFPPTCSLLDLTDYIVAIAGQ